MHFLRKFRRKGVGNGQVLQTNVCRILQVVIILVRERPYVTVCCITHSASPVRLLVHIRNRPVLRAVVYVNIIVACLVLKQETVRPVVHSIEEAGFIGWIPVSVPDSLEEQAKSDAVPVEVEIQAELVVRSLVAYYVQVPMI